MSTLLVIISGSLSVAGGIDKIRLDAF